MGGTTQYCLYSISPSGVSANTTVVVAVVSVNDVDDNDDDDEPCLV